MPPALARALSRNARVKRAFEGLAPSRQKEILQYLYALKTQESLERNVKKVIRYIERILRK
ncbi:MAG: YdeI/OmpD-associated family protein [Candidatus Diapherotrites archaeon]|nr:YdeI/OmpD-associated family protein [Candidatus Diapherotrites archaeon]